MRPKESPVLRKKPVWPGLWFVLGAVVILLFFFWKCLLPQYVHFSNDGPLGLRHAEYYRDGGLRGMWGDLNWLGNNMGLYPPDLTYALHEALSPVSFAKWFPAISLFVLAFGAWVFFRRSKLTLAACVLGALAAMLNLDFFSTACWGVCSQVIAFGFVFLALAALVDPRLPWWLKIPLAGFAVGFNVMEAYDIGAIFSVLVAAFAFYQFLVGEGAPVKKVILSTARVGGIALFAVLLAIQTVVSLVHTQIQGIAGMQQTEAARAQHWNEATQWSLPKRETLGLIIPGLFGYRMDTLGGGNYWGAIGRDAAWDEYFHSPLRPGDSVELTFPDAPNLNTNLTVGPDGRIVAPLIGPISAAGLTPFQLQPKLDDAYAATPARQAIIPTPPGFIRYTGGSNYLGILVALVALWTALQALRGANSVFGPGQRKLIWFWSVVGIVSLLLAWGRYAPFYRLVYSLPYASTVRSPTKFLHVVSFATVVLFAFGIDGLYRRYLNAPLASFSDFGARFKNWRSKASAFERRWLAGMALAIMASVVGWIVYAASRGALEKYLGEVQFSGDMAHLIAGFSISRVGSFVLFLALSVAVVGLILTGALAGRRSRWAAILMGAILLADFVHADSPWVVFWNYQQKYETYGPDPIIQFLRQKPYEHRVVKLPFRVPQQLALFGELYDIEWIQQLFQYYDIQSMDLVQMPRMPQDMENFETAFFSRGSPEAMVRRWELTNTRYLLGPAGFLPVLDQQMDPVQHRFHIVTRFDVVPKPGVERATQLSELTAEPATNGEYALFEFTGALPRAKLYVHWQVQTNDQTTLNELTSPSFDPHQTVLVAAPAPTSTNAPGQADGTVEISEYTSRDIVLKARATTSSILLLNDKYDSDWRVSVDGARAPMLRCNYIMRGVWLSPGSHTVQFVFSPSARLLPISLAAIALGLVLLAGAVFIVAVQPAPQPPDQIKSS